MSLSTYLRFKLRRTRLRPWLLGGLVVVIIVQIVALSPSSLEQSRDPLAVPAETLIVEAEKTLATGIPKGKIPEYSVDKFNYVATQSGQKQWKLVADRAFMYSVEKVVHTREVTAYLFDTSGQITVVTGREGKYMINGRDLEIFGDVVTKFPDGFTTYSEYMRYRPSLRMIDVPAELPVHGGGEEPDGQKISFESHGLEFMLADRRVILPRTARLTMIGRPTEKAEGPEETTIVSDRCVIERAKQIAHFTMNSSRPVDSRFVQIYQPTMYARARRSDLNYGPAGQVLQYMTAYDDVLIKEKGKEAPKLRYGTGGRADFDAHRSVVVLRQFPQVYQDNDTVTGDIITVHRDDDIVEVEHSNAFSSGNVSQ